MSATLTDGFGAFAAARREREPAWLATRRADARTAFDALGLPTTRHEDWRFTSLDRLDRSLPPAERPALDDDLRAGIARAAEIVGHAARLVFVDGHHVSEASSLVGAELTYLAPLGSMLSRAEARIGALADPKAEAIDALNTALFSDGAWIDLPTGTEAGRPLHLLFVHTGAANARHVRNLISLGAGAAARVVEHHVGTAPGPGLTTAVTEVDLREDARLEHVRLQDEADGRFHLGALHARLGDRATLRSHALALGASLARLRIHVALLGEGAHTDLFGLYTGRDRQHLDHHTTIDHALPRTTSVERYKGILDDRARGVFHGRIHVRPDAQGIDARQTNRALLLADSARINSKPQLEIHADDVQCSHGASVGSLDPDALFYLRARGLGKPEARALLTLAFAREVSDELPLDPLREAVETRVLERLSAGRRP